MNKNITYKRALLFLFILATFVSCTSSFKTIYVETAKPSDSMLPNDVVSLTLMNRTMTDEFQNYQKDSLQRYFYKQQFQVNSVILDSTAADTTLKVLGDVLFDSGRYDVVIPEDRNIYRGLRFYKLPKELNWDYVQNICDLYNTDALLVLERFYNKINTDFQIAGYSYTGDEVYGGSIDSKYDAVLRVYDPRKKKVVKEMIVSDTIYWYNDAVTQTGVFDKLPSIKEALIETGIQVALDIDDRLSPSWLSSQRGFFVIDNDAEKIYQFVNSGDWESAYNYWEPFAESTNKGKRSKAEYNLAVASEMLGDINTAIEWADKSYYSQYRKQTENYLTRLGQRKKALEKFKELEN